MIGYKFAKLTVIKKQDEKHWICECECGNKIIATNTEIKRKYIKNCGCDKTKRIVKHTHNNRIYNIYYGMKRRCLNKENKDYKNYGAKGITICKEWQEDFLNFYNWAINNGYADNLSIDRIDNNGNYEPNNCRWVTMQEQHRNYSQNRNYTINNQTRCLTEWCEIYHMKYTTVIDRLKKGATILDALTKPIDKNKIPKKYRKE